MPFVVLQQVSSEFSRKNAAGTLDKPVAVRFLERYIDLDLASSLHREATDGGVRIWGAKWERSHQFSKMPPRESIVLFRRGKTVFAHGAIAETTINEPLAESLWGRDPTDGKTWPLIFFLRRLVLVNKDAAKLNLALQRKPNDNWQGLTSIYLDDSPKLQDYFSAELASDALPTVRTDTPTHSPSAIQRQR